MTNKRRGGVATWIFSFFFFMASSYLYSTYGTGSGREGVCIFKPHKTLYRYNAMENHLLCHFTVLENHRGSIE
jgi:hypothetical protein